MFLMQTVDIYKNEALVDHVRQFRTPSFSLDIKTSYGMAMRSYLEKETLNLKSTLEQFSTSSDKNISETSNQILKKLWA
jgi:hypothetical protein